MIFLLLGSFKYITRRELFSALAPDRHLPRVVVLFVVKWNISRAAVRAMYVIFIAFQFFAATRARLGVIRPRLFACSLELIVIVDCWYVDQLHFFFYVRRNWITWCHTIGFRKVFHIRQRRRLIWCNQTRTTAGK